LGSCGEMVVGGEGEREGGGSGCWSGAVERLAIGIGFRIGKAIESFPEPHIRSLRELRAGHAFAGL